MKEEYGEGDILEFLHIHKVKAWKNISAGFFNTKKGYFQKHKSNFVINGISDILGHLEGKILAIEVKTKKEISFFNRDIETLKQKFIEAQMKNAAEKTLEKYIHAIEQRTFIDEVNADGGIGFYAIDIKDTIRELGARGYNIS